MTATPAIEGWFTSGDEPALVGTKCTACQCVYFPREDVFCKNPACDGEEFADFTFSRTGTVWSYTDARYQPPAPYSPATEPYEPFALAAVELPEGIVVLGQLASGFGVADVLVGDPVEVVVERAWTDPDGADRAMWKWCATETSEARASDRGRGQGQRPTGTSEARA